MNEERAKQFLLWLNRNYTEEINDRYEEFKHSSEYV